MFRRFVSDWNRKNQLKQAADSKRRYVRKASKNIRLPIELVTEMKQARDYMLQAGKNKKREQFIYYKARYQALQWVLKEKDANT